MWVSNIFSSQYALFVYFLRDASTCMYIAQYLVYMYVAT